MPQALVLISGLTSEPDAVAYEPQLQQYNRMALCNLCREIPWENLPTVPPESWPSSSGYPYLQDFHHWPVDNRGYLHHQSLGALRNAANNEDCGICFLILNQIQSCEAELEELKPQWEAGTITQYGWPLWEMWIVKREVGGDGFWVMSTTDSGKRTVRLVAAIGLCVEDGKIEHTAKED